MPSTRHFVRYHQALERPLLERHDSDVHVVGKIDGMLAVLAALNSYVNHAPTFGFAEVESLEALAAELARPEYPEGVTFVEVGDWRRAVRAALQRVAIAEGDLARPLVSALGAVIDDVDYLMGILFAGQPVRSYELVHSGSGGRGVFGYISDASLAFVVDGRSYLLALGWSD
jgi:hypothetical protein